jgi:hypothetical protein
MNLKAFGVSDPPNDANPTFARSNSLAFWKKAISFLMPNRLIPWYTGRNEGNPTRSIEINNLIMRVKKKEVQKQGAASQSRRAIAEDEYRTSRIYFKITTGLCWSGVMVCLLLLSFNFT